VIKQQVAYIRSVRKIRKHNTITQKTTIKTKQIKKKQTRKKKGLSFIILVCCGRNTVSMFPVQEEGAKQS
jgi:hypothetical protein